MSKPVNKTMIGLFVVGAIALVVVAIGVLGSGKFFKQTLRVVCYFEGSVGGLNIGAPVVFRGVKVGSVTDILLRFDAKKLIFVIPVYIEIEPDKIQTVGPAPKVGGENYQVLIDRGLRALLEMQSFVTGQLQVGLDIDPNKRGKFADFRIDTETPEIPTIPTPLAELTKKLESLPLEEIFNNANSAMDGIAKLVQSPDLKESIANLNIALKDVQSLVRNVDAQVKPLGAGLSETIRDTQKLVKNADSQVASLGPNLNEAIGDGRKLIRNIDGSVESIKVNLEGTLSTATAALQEAKKLIQDLESTTNQDSSLMYQLNETLQEVGKAARSLSTLTDYLERHPEALLGGKGDGGGK
jgi:paraquat-inducible protein B